jgi:hypothetical protein
MRPGCDHSPPTGAGVNETRIYTSTPHLPSWRNDELLKAESNLPLPSIVILQNGYSFIVNKRVHTC